MRERCFWEMGFISDRFLRRCCQLWINWFLCCGCVKEKGTNRKKWYIPVLCTAPIQKKTLSECRRGHPGGHRGVVVVPACILPSPAPQADTHRGWVFLDCPVPSKTRGFQCLNKVGIESRRTQEPVPHCRYGATRLIEQQ